MSAYSQNTGAFLYIGTSTSDPLPAPGSDSFTEIEEAQVLAPVQWERSVGTYNVLNDTSKRSVGGKLGDQTITGTIVLDETIATHATFFSEITAAGSGQKRNWRLVWPSGKQEDFVAFISRVAPASFDATGDAAPHTFEFTLSVSGSVTRT